MAEPTVFQRRVELFISHRLDDGMAASSAKGLRLRLRALEDAHDGRPLADLDEVTEERFLARYKTPATRKRAMVDARRWSRWLRDRGELARPLFPRTDRTALPVNPGDVELIEEHLAEMRFTNRRPATIYQRRRALFRLSFHLDPASLLTATTAQISGFLDSDGSSPEYRATQLAHVRQFYKWAQRHGHIAVEPSASIPRPRVTRRLPRPIPDADLAVAFDNAPDRIRPWLYLAAYAGLRAAEIAQLRVEDVNTAELLIIVRESKGGGMSSVPMHPDLAAVLDAACGGRSSGWLFTRGDGGPGPNSPWRVSQVANEYLHSQGISSTLHALRHWFGTNAYRASGRDLRVTQELLRHATPISSAIYTYIDPAEGRAAVDRLPVVGGAF
ncbi:MAG: tyrosine-type recombinase/integrase [Nocardioidaceae bacterium]|nr:tyrosine-type recombinase/integrase [Nocardioidaceae bacterium]